MIKNQSGQDFIVYAFDATNNLPVTGDAANITATVYKDYGAGAATNDTNPTELSDGYYAFDATQTETNADAILVIASSTTPNVVLRSVPEMIYPNGTGALTATQDTALTEIWQRMGLDVNNPLVITQEGILSGNIELGLSGDGRNNAVVTRGEITFFLTDENGDFLIDELGNNVVA